MAGIGHKVAPLNFGGWLVHGEQTTNRVELMAVKQVLELELRAVEARTDGRYL